MASKQKIAAVVGLLCEAFNRKPTAATFMAYEFGLTQVDDEALNEAMNVVLRGAADFMPTPGQLRQLCVTGGRTYAARADIAWHEFDRAVSLHGADHSVSFADGLINATVTLLGGWIHCCEKTNDDYFVWLQKQFKDTYLRLCQSAVNDELLRPLVGRLQIDNHGFPDHVLGRLTAYTGQAAIVIGTSQPVIAGPSKPCERIERRSPEAPRIEFKKA